MTNFEQRKQQVDTQYNAGRDINVYQPPLSQIEKQRKRDRNSMLERVQTIWIDGVLKPSVQGAAQIVLDLQTKPSGVVTPLWHVLREYHTTGPLSSADTSIVQVYDHANGEVLILGEPGAGKTTLLLELTRALLERARQDETHPIPVVFILSSWAQTQQPLTEWLASELVATYQVPRVLAKFWIENDQVLPLLDGLDEVESNHRAACVEAINTYRKAHGLLPTVVCSRQIDYFALSIRLLLRTAVVVQPLTPEQIESYLTSSGEELEALRQTLQKNADLQALASTPLMLNVLTVTYKETSERQLSTQQQPLQQQIWTDYVQRMVDRKQPGNARRYSLSQTRSWLGWLAQQMRLHNQTIFYGERLQADWLPNRLLRAFTWLAERIPAIVIGMLANLLVWFFLGYYDLTTLFQVGFVGAFLGGWLNQLPRLSTVSPTNPPPGKKQPSRVLVAYMGSSLVLGTLFGACFGFNVNGSVYSPGDWLREGILSAIGIGLSGWVMLSLLFRVSQPAGFSLTKPESHRFFRTHWLNSIHLRRAAVIALVWGTDYWLSLVPSKGLWYGLSTGLIFGLAFGFTGFLLSLTLEDRGRMFRLAERLRWDARHLIRPRHLRNSLLFAGLLFLTTGLHDGLRYGLTNQQFNWLNGGLSTGLAYGLGYWLLFGLSQGIVQEQMDDQDRSTFNQGIGRSLRNSFLTSLLGGGILLGTNVLSAGLRFGLFGGLGGLWYGLSSVLRYGPFLALSGGLLIWAAVGGLTVLQHYIMRFLLARSHTFPWRAQAFLDDAVARILLRRVGGGYSFVHRLLLDYFANLHTEPPPTSAIHSPAARNSPPANSP